MLVVTAGVLLIYVLYQIIYLYGVLFLVPFCLLLQLFALRLDVCEQQQEYFEEGKYDMDTTQ